MSATRRFNRLPSSVGRAPALAVAALLVASLLPSPAAAAMAPAFLTQPGGAVYNQPFAPEAAVAIKDGGSVATSASGLVALAIASGTGTPGAVLTCTGSGTGGRTFSLVNGVATATGCAIDKAGSGYRLTVAWSQGGIGTSAAFDVRTGPPAKLGFAVQAGGAIESLAFFTQPTVEVQDAAGQRVATGSASVTLSIASGTGAGGALVTCAGGNTVVAVAGVALFSGCAIDRAAVGYALSASAVGLASGTGAAFNVASPTPARIGFVVQPARGTPTTALAVQPSVAIQDANGVTIPTASPRLITLDLGANPGGGTLTCSGGLSRTTVNGVATFSGCLVSRVGVGYSLLASTPGFLAATGASFDVADRLIFNGQPTGGTAGEPFASAPVLLIRAGPTYASSNDQGTRVTLSLKAGTGTAGAVLSCDDGLTQTVVNGLVGFAGCTIDRAGSGYVLTAAAARFASVATAPFSVGPGSFTVTPSAATVTYGGSVVLAVYFHPASGSGAARTISLTSTDDGVIWSTIGTVVTDSGGRASFSYKPSRNLTYRAIFAASGGLAGVISPTTRVVVRQTASLRPSNGGLVKIIRRGTAVTFSTTVRPALFDLPIPTATFFFYRQVGGVWTNVAKRVVTAGSAGVARTTWTFQTAGEWYVRSMANTTLYNASSVLTPIERYSAR